jgi:hypothetical protein
MSDANCRMSFTDRKREQQMTDVNEEFSDEERAKRRANYLARLDSEGPARIVTDPVQIAEGYARLAELGIVIDFKPATKAD